MNSASEAASGASERIGGLLSCQPSAPRSGGELRLHEEAPGPVVTPPAREPWQVVRLGVPLVHEAPADGAGAGVQIFVAAPHGEIRARVVQRERHVADRVRQIEAHATAVSAGRRRVARPDPGVRRTDTARQATGRARFAHPPSRAACRSARDRARRCRLAGRARAARPPGRGRASAAATRRRSGRRGTRRARSGSCSAAPSAERTSRASGADSPSACSSRRLRRAGRRSAPRAARRTAVVIEPAAMGGTPRAAAGAWRARVREVAVDAERGPALELRRDGAPRRARHQPQRMTAEIGQRAAPLARQREPAPKARSARRRRRAHARRRRRERAQSEAPAHLGGATVPQRLHVRASALP